MCSRNPPLAPPIAVKPSGGVLVLANDTAVHLVPVKSSARNTIETVFCHRRNHISASALNATSQQMTNGGRVPAERALTIPEGQKKGSYYETMRPMPRKAPIGCPLS